MKAIVVRCIAFATMAVVLSICVHDRLWGPVERFDADPPETSNASPERAEAALQAVRTQVEFRKSVRVRVADSTGRALTGVLVGSAGEYSIEGVGLVPPDLGRMRVLVPGFVPLAIDIEEVDVACVMERGNVVSGVCVDARSRQGIPGAEMEIRALADGGVSIDLATDADGWFQTPPLAEGDYVVRARADGYLPLSKAPDASLPGVRVAHPSASTDVRLVMYPMFVGIVTVLNETNLRPDVLRGLLFSRPHGVPGMPLPAVQDREIMRWISGVAAEQGGEFWYAESCLIDRSDAILTGSVEFRIMDESCGTATVSYRPRPEVRQRPAPDVFVLRGSWECSSLEVETPVPLVVTRDTSGIVFGGVHCAAGITRLELPVGQYWLRPPDVLSLVDKEQWSRRIDIPGDRSIRMGGSAEFGTLGLRVQDVSGSGFVTIKGRQREIGVSLQAIPCEIPASPGQYEVILHAGQADEFTVKWRQAVEVAAGETKEIIIGVGR